MLSNRFCVELCLWMAEAVPGGTRWPLGEADQAVGSLLVRIHSCITGLLGEWGNIHMHVRFVCGLLLHVLCVYIPFSYTYSAPPPQEGHSARLGGCLVVAVLPFSSGRHRGQSHLFLFPSFNEFHLHLQSSRGNGFSC